MSKTAADVRREFIAFFEQRGHTFVAGSPVVPYDDPTLLFTNAGMNQFKDVFLATGTRPYTRAANSQPCIRAGGKHNDLDDVGGDTYHHTFFEMLGNWSFGDYFKRDAIRWAWELLTDVWGIEKDRLHATYFGGDERDGLAPDLEARDLWASEAGLPPERIHPGSKKDNFWEMGETGPCGPCSEVHVDLTPDKSGAALVNAGSASVIEIWNLVFIQFNRGPDGKLTPLPAKHVDTGMGFERVTAVLQGHNNNYGTDVFIPLIEQIEQFSGHRYGATIASPPKGNRFAAFDDKNMQDVACRVIADHIRCLTFALADGAVPDRDGRGYVLRRILRRAVRYGWQYLGLHELFLCRMVPNVVDVMAEAFPKLRSRPDEIAAIIRDEEESFARTLDRGIALFEEAAETATKDHHGELRGEDVFKLHDTYGFPVDLTEIMAAERGLRVDIGEYERRMEAARERARSASKGMLSALAAITADSVAGFGPTDDQPKYDAERVEAKINAIVRLEADGGATLLTGDAALQAGQAAAVIVDRTCFYGEQGGQVGDRGNLTTDAGEFDIEDTQRLGEVVLHVGSLSRGELRAGSAARLRVDPRREQIRRNHTATHVLNWALRETLGDHVQQKGSLVDPDKTRFDFSHPKALDAAELERIEQRCAAQISADHEVFAEVADQEAALKINSLRAVFGEKYPPRVRVVSIGQPVSALLSSPDNADWRGYSIEFCGGTHVRRTGEIEQFVLTAEEAVAKGIRRLVGVSGPVAKRAIETARQLAGQADALGNSEGDVLAEGIAAITAALADAVLPLRDKHALRERVATLQQRVKQQAKAHAAEAADVVKEQVEHLLGSAEKIGGTTVLVAELPDVPVDQLKTGADIARQKSGSAAVFFGVKQGEKVLLLAAMSDDLVKKGVKAGDLVKQVAPLVEGGGGGPPTMAQAGGKNPGKLPEALEAARAWIRGKLR